MNEPFFLTKEGEVLAYHAQQAALFGGQPGLGQGRFKIGVGTARPQHLVADRKLRGDGPSPPLFGRILESALGLGLVQKQEVCATSVGNTVNRYSIRWEKVRVKVTVRRNPQLFLDLSSGAER